ncbi:MAG: hypothetical protein V2I97_20910 [Desulfococcaceae bacterium]|jgi:hypothetical protein|nr:hypothetical protein [Desulfococcaceae bacterium]
MKRALFVIILTCLISTSVQASELVDNRIHFYSYMGYVVEKFVVPDTKGCVTSIRTEAMDKDGIHNIAISDSTDDPNNVATLFQSAEWYDGNSTIVIDLSSSPVYVTPGMPIMLYVLYLTKGMSNNFSVPVSPGNGEIGHYDVDDPFKIPIAINIESGYSVFALEYGCEAAILPGNIDGKDGLTLADAVMALRMLAGFQTDDICIDAEINGDQKIGMEDVLFILKKLSTSE